jgi:LmbE family N-acetylglucosaminyl deacetylase
VGILVRRPPHVKPPGGTFPPGAEENGGIFGHANTWAVVAASWAWVAATRWILGIRPTCDGRRVAPVVPGRTLARDRSDVERSPAIELAVDATPGQPIIIVWRSLMSQRRLSRPVTTLILACGGLAAAALSGAPARAEDDSRTLLAVFAHPDDETSVGPLLARYAREGVTVHLAIATDGQKGVREHAGIPAGAPLAARRAEEARCACTALGIEPPILMGLEDGAMAQEESKATLLREVSRLLAELKPDAIVTWGPEGLSGHTDHRIVSSIVTEAFQSAEDPPGQLYYVGFATESVAKLKQMLEAQGQGMPLAMRTVRERFLPVRIAYEEEDGEANARSHRCHESQYTAEEMAAVSGLGKVLQRQAVTLRPWFVDPGPLTSLFE